MTSTLRLTGLRIIPCGILWCFASTSAFAGPQSGLADRIDAFMADLMNELDVVPGYSISVATPESTIIAKGYGVTAASGDASLNADTQVYIASSTKSFTALAIASLANRGLIDLDSPIANYVDRLAGTAAGGTTLRQLLSHTHGLEEDGLTWRTAYSGDYSTESLLRLVEGMTRSNSAGAFEYSNTGYVVASLVLEYQFGKSWKKIVEEEVLMPVRMSTTTAYVSALDNRYARPHSWYGLKNELPLSKQDNTMHAAGGHFSTASDMALWLQAQLSDGEVNGRRVFPPGLVASTHEPIASVDADFYSYHRHHYCLGWYEADYRGHRMFHQFGSFAGYRSHVSFIPDLGIGVAVLANDLSRPGFNLPDMIANLIYDLVAGKASPEADLKEEIARIQELIDPLSGQHPPERQRNAPDDESVFAGRYANDEFGTIIFSMTGDGLVAKMGNLESRTTYKEDGSIRMELIPFQGTVGKFVRARDDSRVVGFSYRDAFYRRDDATD